MEKEKLNKAVLRSIDILDYLSHSKKPVTLSAISKDLGIPKSSDLISSIRWCIKKWFRWMKIPNVFL